MQAINDHVYIEDQYPGVTLGVIVQSRGLIQIDAPPSADDARSWRAALMGLDGGTERILINLDAHPDRTLGARAMDCPIIMHEKAARVFRSRPNTFKAAGEETGADWESISGLGSIRWAPPEIAFTDQMALHWGTTPVLLEHHPGPTTGSIWAILPEDKIIFLGDTALKNQPPFLAHADLAAWIESLQLLLSPAYKSYTLVSSRGGVITHQIVKTQLDFIKHVRDRLEKLAAKQASPEAIEKLVDPLLEQFKASAARQKQFAQRLRYGLYHCYTHHYQANHPPSEEELS
jgi:glyoxylase-like metal-dependent hydrolase (beta-lactamase superfamily II)